MTETEFQLLRSAGFALALAVGLGLERLAPHARLRGAWRVNGGLWAVNLVAMGTVCGACMCTASRWADARGIGVLNLASVPAWAALPLTIIALDLVSYGWHRANHRVALLWRFHRVHHSDTRFTVATAIRFHPGELLLSLPLRLLAVTLLGAPVLGVVLFEVLFTTANFLEHGDIDYPPAVEGRLQRLLVTPALHRRHHGDRPDQFGSNFGTMFSLWDHVLGTYADASSATHVRTGLPDQARPLGLREALVLPLA